MPLSSRWTQTISRLLDFLFRFYGRIVLNVFGVSRLAQITRSLQRMASDATDDDTFTFADFGFLSRTRSNCEIRLLNNGPHCWQNSKRTLLLVSGIARTHYHKFMRLWWVDAEDPVRLLFGNAALAGNLWCSLRNAKSHLAAIKLLIAAMKEEKSKRSRNEKHKKSNIHCMMFDTMRSCRESIHISIFISRLFVCSFVCVS